AERYGDLLARSDSIRQAHDYLRELIRTHPDRSAAYISLAMLFARNDEIDSLLSITDTAMVKFPDQSYFPIVRANVLSNRGKNDEAARYLQQVLAIEPDNLQAKLLLANTWEALKQYQLSDSLYSNIITQNPEEAIVLNNYAYSLALRGERLDEAMQMVEKALTIEPENASYLDTKGWLLYLNGKYRDAKTYIEKALSLNPDNVEVLEHMGDVMMKLNQPEEAQKYYRQALEIDSENESLQKKLSR
ncbi:MAG TPA: tetratricopeptide repeat protein, partial [Candidatus Marinimicrobia bacterium]|nr:tetratricopeptide repeat protein [Candidatus Neomarinimicrobiota bacterium]